MSEFEPQTFEDCFRRQKNFFETGATFEFKFRKQALKSLYACVKKFESKILEALVADLGKPPAEGFGGEVGFLYAEISHTLKHLKKWMKPQRVRTPLFLFPARSRIVTSPKGQVLIIGPWNYPVQLQFAPLIGALAAGNTAILKPSEIAVHSTRVVEEIVESCFDAEQVAVFQGEGKQTISAMMNRVRFDHVFFTGSIPVGRLIAEQAAQKLTPVTLELGGKSPAIIDQDVNVALAAKRVTWGKFFNSGQTCVAPDYAIVHKSIKSEFVRQIGLNIKAFYGDQPNSSESLAHMIHERHYEKLVQYLEDGKTLIGGEHDRVSKRIEPTVIDSLNDDSPLLTDEIFGPILPLVTVESRDEVFRVISQHPHPLALYIFTRSKEFEQEVTQRIPFGGGCVNDVVAHLANPNLPFGGVGSSGLGKYHGKFSFDEFSNQKGILRASQKMDLPFRYPPYDEKKLNLFRRLLK